MPLTTKNTVFILTYCEADFFTNTAWSHVDHSNYNFIVLDNGKQDAVKKYCEENHWEYYASEYNIGSTGGYNWIFRAASMLELERAALVQADVEICSIETIDLLFSNDTPDPLVDETSILMWPQTGPENWLGKEYLEGFGGSGFIARLSEGCPVNLGQIFSFNPNHLIFNHLLNDENYVVTHFDDVDLRHRLTYSGVRVCNLAWLYDYKNKWVSTTNQHMGGYVDGLYKIHHISSQIQNHQNWHDYNLKYYEDKCSSKGIDGNKWHQAALRWTEVGYPPFPVEHELNRWWSLRGNK